MFEGKLASVLNGVLGEYVHGISTRDLNVAVFKGDIVLKGMRLKVEALNALGLPFRCLLYTSPSPRDVEESRMPSSA